MRILGGTDLTGTMLRELWLQRLPSNIRAVIATAKSETIDKLAEQADQMLDYSDIGNMPQVNSTKKTNNEMEELRKQIESLQVSIDRINQRGRSLSRDNRRGNSHRRSPTPRRSEEVCWYHQKYGPRATKCRPPCNFSKN